MRNTVHFLAALAIGSACMGALAAAGDPVKVVYHVNEAGDQPLNALRNIGNHLTADPKAKIVVVTHAGGIQFLLDGAKDKNGSPYDVAVQQLVAKGVEFKVCEFTLKRNNIDPKRVIEEAKLVPSGVAEVSRLQAQEGFVYLKP
jgi:intracellular sulfur oxidation DsrE/DsrF family protein